MLKSLILKQKVLYPMCHLWDVMHYKYQTLRLSATADCTFHESKIIYSNVFQTLNLVKSKK